METKRIAQKVRMLFFLSFLLVSLSACIGGFGFALEKHLFGNYYLTAPDVIEQCALTYHAKTDVDIYGGIIRATVFAVGYNEKYLIAKQYYNPNGTPDKSQIRYYILPLLDGSMDWKTKNGLIGTRDSLKFEEMRKELGISDLKFTKKIDIP
jgi:hypothetical protein